MPQTMTPEYIAIDLKSFYASDHCPITLEIDS